MTSKNIAIFLNGSLKNDSRVLKTIRSLSKILDVHVFYINGSDSDKTMFPSNVFLYHKAYQASQDGNWLMRHSFFYKEFSFLYHLAKSVNIEFDLVWANDLPSCEPALRLSQEQNAKFIYDSHEIYLETINQFFLIEGEGIKKTLAKILIASMRFLGGNFEKKIMKRVDLFITVNESIRELFIKNHGIHKAKTMVLMNCPEEHLPDLKPVGDLRARFAWSKEDKIIIYQGVLNDGRGLKIFLEAMCFMNKRFKWIILGDGILRKYFEDYIAKQGLSDNVILLGKVPEAELKLYTQQADFGLNLLEPINLSKQLASPNKLFQYIHEGVPSLCSNTVENRKVLEKYKLGLLTENRVDEIVKNVELLASTNFDQEVFKQAKKEYSWANQEEILLENILKLLNNTTS